MTKQKTITLYKQTGEIDPKVRLVVVSTADPNKFFFRKYQNKKIGSTILDQTVYNLDHSIMQAYEKLKSDKEYNFQRKTGELTGLGLEEIHPKVHWAHRVNRKDKYFVMYPAFTNGHVRFYTTGTRSPEVSQNRASRHFLNIVRDIIDRGTFEQQDYAGLERKEAHQANLFIKHTKPIIPSGVAFSTSHAGDIFELRKRYKVLVGELASGNHGQMIKDEMIGILQTLQRLKAMTKPKVNDLISGLNEL